MEQKENPQNNLILETLRDNYGIESVIEHRTIQELEQCGYREMTASEMDRISPLLHYLPSELKDAYYRSAVQESFDRATKNTYRLKLKSGLHLGNSHKTPGAFVGNAYDDITNKMSTQAEWLKNNPTLDVSNLPQYASYVFNALSFVTGQHFMAQINNKLSFIQDTVNRIESFLNIQSQGSLQADINTISATIQDIEVSDLSSLKCGNPEVGRIRTESDSYIEQYNRHLKTLVEDISYKDAEDIKQEMDALYQTLNYYQEAIDLYSMTLLLDILMNDIRNPEQLELRKKWIDERRKTFLASMDSCLEWLNSYIEVNRKDRKEIFIPSKGQIKEMGYQLKQNWKGLLPWKSWKESHQAIDRISQSTQKYIADRRMLLDSGVNRNLELIKNLQNNIHEYEPAKTIANYANALKNGFSIVRMDDKTYISYVDNT